MSDYVWSAICFLAWFCSSPWHLTALVAACLAVGVWLGTSDRRDMRTEAAAIDAEENGAPWADNAGGGDGWPVDLDAVARLHTDLHYGTGVIPAVGSDPWLRDMWPDAPEWDEAA
jgi:hypothetical protein